MRKRLFTESVTTFAALVSCALLWSGVAALAETKSAAETDADAEAEAEAEAQPSVALPDWTEKDAERFEQPGSALLGGGLWPVELQPTPLPPFPAEAEGMAEEATDEGPMLLPEEIPEIEAPKIVITRASDGLDEIATERETEAALGEAGEVPAEFRAAYFNERPRNFLSDPQRLLTEQKTNDLRRFLEYHEGESKIAIYVLVFGGRQELPAGMTLRDLYHEWFIGDDVVLTAYFLGEPKRSRLEFGDETMAMLGAETVSEALEHCIEEARGAQNPFNQLERFCIELSIRLYWIEKNNGMSGGQTAAAEAQPDEVAAPPTAAGSRVDLRDIAFYGLCLAAMLAGAGWFLWRRFRATDRTFIFPDFEITPRLSAPHSGGAHAVMFFGKKGA